MLTLFQRVFGLEPSRELLNALVACGEAVFSVEVFGPDAEDDVAALLDHLQGYQESKEMILERNVVAYQRLFVGPGAPIAPPWQSAYQNDKRLLFQSSTGEVRQFFTKAGYRAACSPHVAEDHLAIELDFMVALLREALSEDDAGRREERLLLCGEFAEKHVVPWVSRWSEDVRNADCESVYTHLAPLMRALLRAKP